MRFSTVTNGLVLRTQSILFVRSDSLGNCYIYTRTVAKVVLVRVNYEVQQLARADGNSSEAVGLRWRTIGDSSGR